MAFTCWYFITASKRRRNLTSEEWKNPKEEEEKWRTKYQRSLTPVQTRTGMKKSSHHDLIGVQNLGCDSLNNVHYNDITNIEFARLHAIHSHTLNGSSNLLMVVRQYLYFRMHFCSMIVNGSVMFDQQLESYTTQLCFVSYHPNGRLLFYFLFFLLVHVQPQFGASSLISTSNSFRCTACILHRNLRSSPSLLSKLIYHEKQPQIFTAFVDVVPLAYTCLSLPC